MMDVYFQLLLWGWFVKGCSICGKVVCEEDLVVCDECGQKCCEECVTVEYRNFSYYNGSVDIVDVYRACRGYVLVDGADSKRCRK